MATRKTRSFDTFVMLSTDHTGLKSSFHALEAELKDGLARLDSPRDMRMYLDHLCFISRDWTKRHIDRTSNK